MSTIIGKVVSSSFKGLSSGARSVTKEISATKSYLSTSAKMVGLAGKGCRI